MELWDMIDYEKKKTGRIKMRGSKLNPGEYHLVVEIWCITPDHRILVTRRHPSKKYGLLWECTGGAVQCCEESEAAAKRELREETGIEATSLQFTGSVVQSDYIVDVYLYEKELSIEQIQMQEEEVVAAKIISFEDLTLMHEAHQLVDSAYYRFLRFIKPRYQKKKPTFLLRPLHEYDKRSLSVFATNKNIAKTMTDGFPYPYTMEDATIFIECAMNDHEGNQYIRAIDIDQVAVGCIGIFLKEDIHQKTAKIAYWIAQEYWGNGIMTEALKEVVLAAFSYFDIVRIEAEPFATNSASRKVLEAAGFRCEGMKRSSVYKWGLTYDSVIYGLTREDFTLLQEGCGQDWDEEVI